jgi:purine-binding chemotaxis protein CheW
METMAHQERRFASFILGKERRIEVAIPAEDVLEATPVYGAIQPLPDAVPCLEGFMHLRDDAIPVINMKKRLGFPVTDYAADAKVAVVAVFQFRLGLLFDDIQDVQIVDSQAIDPIHPILQTGEGIISHLIKLDNGRRIMELLDLRRLLGNDSTIAQFAKTQTDARRDKACVQRRYSRYVVFSSSGQEYGISANRVREITFPAQVDKTFQNDVIEGALRLRGQMIPMINASRLLQAESAAPDGGEEKRVLVVNADTFQYGLIVDKVREIISIAEDAVMPLPLDRHDTVSGIYAKPGGSNIMLVRVDTLIADQLEELRSVARLNSSGNKERGQGDRLLTRHLITADCYLIFSIGRNFAIELNDVQEIIESRDLIALPEAGGCDGRVLNLRGAAVPVVDLRTFYGYDQDDTSPEKKLIIARSHDRVIALEVDRILTIHKQVQYNKTPSLTPQLNNRKDTLDRLIEFIGETGITEHILVLNIEAMMDNHLDMAVSNNPFDDHRALKGGYE